MNTETKHLQMVYTRFVGPTTKGSRIVASIPGRRTKVTWPVDHALSAEKNHEEAARKAVRWKLDLFGDDNYVLIGSGDTPNEKGHAFVFERIYKQEI